MIDRVMYKRDHYAIRRDGADVIGVQVLVDLPNVHGLLEAIRHTVATFYGYEPGGEIGGRLEWHELGWESQTEHDDMWRDVLALVPDDPEQRARIRDAVLTARAECTLPPAPPYSVTQLDALDRLVRDITDNERTQPHDDRPDP